MQKHSPLLVLLGTGGTIAGTAARAEESVGYVAAQLSVSELLRAVPVPAGSRVEVEQIAQLDSKDMSFEVWLALAQAVNRHLSRPEVNGIVITHGSDTLEETAYFLQRLLAPAKPVVLVAAMRPATALQADGPQNLLDALRVALVPDARGVVAVLAGEVHSGLDVRKVHTFRLDAFGSGDAGVVAHVEEGRLRRHRDWPSGEPIGLAALPLETARWPRVEVLVSHAGSGEAAVRALHGAGADGIVIAGSGNGSVHCALERALLELQSSGSLAVLRCSRCPAGSVIDPAGGSMLQSAGSLTLVQARIELMLQLMLRVRA